MNDMDWLEYSKIALGMLFVVCIIAVTMAIAYKAVCWIV